MALPPALAVRLKKRGILKVDHSANIENDQQEEIIAADYSGDVQPDLSKEQIIIDNDHLPHGWWKVKDPPSGFVYFWDSNTDMNMQIGRQIPSDIPLPALKMPPRRSGGERSRRDRDKVSRRRQKDELDHMDPAAFSEAPRGSWSSRLPNQGEAKTGVDVTAKGPLFQMRPYPSPGEIMRTNKSAPPPDTRMVQQEPSQRHLDNTRDIRALCLNGNHRRDPWTILETLEHCA